MLTSCITVTGVDFIANFCTNIAFWGCCTYSSHTVVTVRKMTTPTEQVMAQWWLLRHSMLYLLALLSGTHGKASLINEGRNWDV